MLVEGRVLPYRMPRRRRVGTGRGGREAGGGNCRLQVKISLFLCLLLVDRSADGEAKGGGVAPLGDAEAVWQFGSWVSWRVVGGWSRAPAERSVAIPPACGVAGGDRTSWRVARWSRRAEAEEGITEWRCLGTRGSSLSPGSACLITRKYCVHGNVISGHEPRMQCQGVTGVFLGQGASIKETGWRRDRDDEHV